MGYSLVIVVVFVVVIISVIILAMRETYYIRNGLQNKYNTAAKQVFETMNQTGSEWWPTEGTLIGIIRWGSNFSRIEDGLIATDVDIDVMVRVSSKQDWKRIKKIVEQQLTSKSDMWRGFDERNEKNFNMFTGRTHYSFRTGGEAIELDLHAYYVDEKENKVYIHRDCVDDDCSGWFPFQWWGGNVPYRGFLLGDDDQFLKGKFNDMDVPCPYKSIEILSHWNDNEYGDGSDLNLPLHNFIYRDGGWDDNNYEITEKDKKELHTKAEELHSKGYISFIDYYE